MSGERSAAADRVRLVYQTQVGDRSVDKELPLKLLVLADVAGRHDPTPIADRRSVAVTAGTLDAVIAAQRIRLRLTVADHLGPDAGGELAIELAISALADFAPDALLARVPALAESAALRHGLATLKAPLAQRPELARRLAAAAAGAALPDGVIADLAAGADAAVIARALATLHAWLAGAGRGQAADRGTIDGLIAELDRRLSRQLDAILHHPRFQALEASWCGLAFLVGRIDPADDIRVHLLHATKGDLQADFEDAPEITRSGLYRQIYTAEYGQFGGEPFAALIADHEFGPGAADIALLQKVAAVSAMAHCPFIAAAAPRFFGLDRFDRLPELADLRAALAGPQFAKWNAFRDSEDARSVALTLPRFLLRPPYGRALPVRGFAYVEETRERAGAHLWGNAAFAFALCVAGSFARTRWCPHIIGPQNGGAVGGLAELPFASLPRTAVRMPTEIAISERREAELAECGFVPLVARGPGETCFFSASSCQRPRSFGQAAEGRVAELNHRLGTQLPYLFVVNRLAHYLKVIQRERIGTWADRLDLARELNRWIGRHVVDMDDPDPLLRATHPLRSAQVSVEDVPGDAGWYRIALAVSPHLRHLGASFTLSLVGKLDKA